MIVFDLQCALGHRFEGWFGSGDDFGAQKAKGLLSCPNCGSDEIARLPSATRFNAGAAESPQEGQAGPAAAAADTTKRPPPGAHALMSMALAELIKRTEDVGSEFPAEARRMFYEETPARPIRGVASQKEHEDLVEEGIPVARFPLPDPNGWH